MHRTGVSIDIESESLLGSLRSPAPCQCRVSAVSVPCQCRVCAVSVSCQCRVSAVSVSCLRRVSDMSVTCLRRARPQAHKSGTPLK